MSSRGCVRKYRGAPRGGLREPAASPSERNDQHQLQRRTCQGRPGDGSAMGCHMLVQGPPLSFSGGLTRQRGKSALPPGKMNRASGGGSWQRDRSPAVTIEQLRRREQLRQGACRSHVFLRAGPGVHQDTCVPPGQYVMFSFWKPTW